MELLQGPLIITKHHGPTTYRDARISAIHRRDSDQKLSVTLSWDHSLTDAENAKAAALALLQSWPYQEHHQMALVACGFDHDHYYFIASTAPTSPA